jgi:hypothetical protein
MGFRRSGINYFLRPVRHWCSITNFHGDPMKLKQGRNADYWLRRLARAGRDDLGDEALP